jgi:hypothetical protein
MLPVPKRWPTPVERQKILNRLGVSLYPNQAAASAWVTGPRDQPVVVQVIGGERAGKSQWIAHELTCLLLWCDLIYLAGASYDNCQREFEYLEDNLRALGLLADGSVHKPQNGGWSMAAVSGCQIETLSFTRGVDALIATGKAPDCVALCEAGLLEHEHFSAAFARVAERRGAVLLAGTLKRARQWYVALYRQLQQADNPYRGRSFSFPSSQNTAIYPRGEADPTLVALRAALGNDVYAERMGAEPVPSPLLVFGRDYDYVKHVRDVVYDSKLPLWLACDPGYAGAYALLVVQAASASDIRVIGEYYQQYGMWHTAIAWLRQQSYVKQDSAGNILGVERAVMDIAGRQHHADVSQAERWRDETGIVWRMQPVGIETGISRLRDFLRNPFNGESRISINPACEGLLWELGEGEQYPRDQAGNPVRELPVDAHNHSRKALSYLLVDAYGRTDSPPTPNVPGHDRFAAMRQSQPEAARRLWLPLEPASVSRVVKRADMLRFR